MGVFVERKNRQEKLKLQTKMYGIGIMAICSILFVLMCLPLGIFSDFVFGVFGLQIFPLCLIGILVGLGLFSNKKYQLSPRLFVFMLMNFFSLCCLLHAIFSAGIMKDGGFANFGEYLANCYHLSPKLTVGGAVAGIFVYFARSILGVVGCCILFAIILCVFVGLSIDSMLVKRDKVNKKSISARALDDEIVQAGEISAISNDFQVSATKIVPKKFDLEDEKRYKTIHGGIKKQDYYTNKLMGGRLNDNMITSTVPTYEDVESGTIETEVDEFKSPFVDDDDVNPDPFDVVPVEMPKTNAHDILFGDDKISETDSFESDKPASPMFRSMKDKVDYIKQPVLPDYLTNNSARLDRTKKSILPAQDDQNPFVEWKNDQDEKDEPVSFEERLDISRLRTTQRSVPKFDSPVSSFEDEESVSSHLDLDKQKESFFAGHRSEPKSNSFDSFEDDTDKDNSFEDHNVVRPTPFARTNTGRNSFAKTDFNIQKNDDIDYSKFDNEFVEHKPTGVRGKDLQPRKSPERRTFDRGVFGGVSDIVEEERSSFVNRVNPIKATEQIDLVPKTTSFIKPELMDRKYNAPPTNILKDISDDPSKYGADYKVKGQILENTLESFKIPAKVSNVVRGPSVTRYELAMPLGIPVKTVERFDKDIAMALMSKAGIRLEVPIPGKNAFGVEVPNDNRSNVGLREILESKEFTNTSQILPVAIGKNISGEVIVQSMPKMVHCLVAGSTGSGKSVFLHSLIMSLMYKASPENLKFIIIDPKRVEFSIYNGMPHLILPNVITEVDKAINALGWLTKEMDRRFRTFQQYSGCQNIEAYNALKVVKDGIEKKMPYIVLVVDELADLMMQGKREVEDKVRRLTQLGRACGIHLVVATQRPSVEVITGTIKSNMPTRIAFSLTSQIDSRTILDEGGAEKLLGKGDMLFSPQGSNTPHRLQAAFVSMDEVADVIQYIKDHNESIYDEELEKEMLTSDEDKRKEEASQNGSSDDDDDGGVDEYFWPSVKMFIETGAGSTSMLQRRFSLGYNRAARLVDKMEAEGYISPQNGSKKRSVYITMEEYQNLSGDID